MHEIASLVPVTMVLAALFRRNGDVMVLRVILGYLGGYFRLRAVDSLDWTGLGWLSDSLINGRVVGEGESAEPGRK